MPDPASVSLKARAEHPYIGKPVRNIYSEDFATGRAVFGQDVRREGMAYAVAVPGALDVVELPVFEFPMRYQPLGGVAVVATNGRTCRARKGV